MNRQLTPHEQEFLRSVNLMPNKLRTAWRDASFVMPIPGCTRWVGRTHHGDRGYTDTFQARLYQPSAEAWVSPDFDDPISAYVYAQSMNWGQ